MNKFLDILAYVIIFTACVIGVFGYAMYRHPDIVLPVVIGIGSVLAILLAKVRLYMMRY